MLPSLIPLAPALSKHHLQSLTFSQIQRAAVRKDPYSWTPNSTSSIIPRHIRTACGADTPSWSACHQLLINVLDKARTSYINLSIEHIPPLTLSMQPQVQGILTEKGFPERTEVAGGGLLDIHDANSLEVTPVRMRYRDLPNATKATMRNLKEDPLVMYLNNTTNTQDNFVVRAMQKVAITYAWWRELEHGVTWTVDGLSFLIYYNTRRDPKRLKTPLDKLMDAIVSYLGKIFFDRESMKRSEEYQLKMEAAIQASIGEKVNDMLLVANLITLREARGRGYASALVRMATSVADLDDRGSWLVSSNIANEGFYNSLGFVTVQRFVVGENNPTWDRAPVPVDIMVRVSPKLDVFKRD